ncbi:SRPBCC family protein [Mycolicibacterium phlei]
MQGNSISVERVIAAPAAAIFALLSDAAKHSAFEGSGTLEGTTARAGNESRPLTLGSRFSMAMRSRPESLFLPYRTTNTVVEFEPDRRIAWQTTMGPLGLIGGRIWRYELEPVGPGATLVRESWDVAHDRQRLLLTVGGATRQAEDGMRATLARLAALVENA